MFRLAVQSFVPVFNHRMIHSSYPAMSELMCTFASPAEVFYDNKAVTQVDVPGLPGHFGVLADHVPTLGSLKPGVLQITDKDGVMNKYFVSSGTFTVNDDSSIQILAEEAIPLDRLDVNQAREGMTKAQQEMSSGSDKVEAQVSFECYEAVIKALENK